MLGKHNRRRWLGGANVWQRRSVNLMPLARPMHSLARQGALANRVFRTQFTDLGYGDNTELMFQEVPNRERRRISVAGNVRAVRAPTAALPAMLAEVMNTTEKGVRIVGLSFIVIRGRPPGLAA
jgi:hypothetical protein